MTSATRRENARRARRTGFAAGAWIVPAALAVFFGLCLYWQAPRLQYSLSPVAPVQEIEDYSVVRVEGEERLDVNRATAEELRQLPGIGEVLSERIVAWREDNGPFDSLERLMEVEGIGEGRLEAIRDRITVGE